MKGLLLLIVCIAACGANVLKVPVQGYEEGERYFYFLGDDDEQLRLVDAEEPADWEFIEQYTRSQSNSVYWLFTRANPTTSQVIRFGNASSVTNSNIDFSKITVFLAHGWLGDGSNKMNTLLTEAFLHNDDVNVIVRDWGALANKGYNTAKSGTAAVGRGLGKFINWLTGLGLSYEKVHLVGFSLGGHLVGNAGRETGAKVKRITALDPAGPMWLGDTDRIVATDGQYVEVIHTSIVYGYNLPCGDADFYPNYVLHKTPGCGLNSRCSHSRSYEYMASTVIYNHLIGKECKNLIELIFKKCTGDLHPMGNSDISKSKSGIFKVQTKEDYPF